MANLKAGKGALDMSDLGISLDGTVMPSTTNVRIAYTDGGYTDFGGTYQFISPTQFTGTVTSITHVEDGKVRFSVTDVNADAQRLFALIDSGDIQGAEAYVLRDDDVIDGGRRGDTLYGFGGDDVISGGAGRDVLVGGEGADTLKGGTEADVFAYWSDEDSGIGRDARDTIIGFSHLDGDKIDLSAIDANENTTRNEKFSFVADFTGKAGELTVDQVSGGWLVLGDTDGRDGADFSIFVKADGPLVATDFVL